MPWTVYPRTGGGNPGSLSVETVEAGLSPHGRGKLAPVEYGCPCGGSIPARAGETPFSGCTATRKPVYPRTGGGNRVQSSFPEAGGRSIPARAGETDAAVPGRGGDEVYPRTGGGNPGRRRRSRSIPGLSPHGRGKQIGHNPQIPQEGSIPARAGETQNPPAPDDSAAVYPRTGGGNVEENDPEEREIGLSPHGRGKPWSMALPGGGAGSIPARAGETPSRKPGRSGWAVYPRTGGGNRTVVVGEPDEMGLSPHGRGKRINPR